MTKMMTMLLAVAILAGLTSTTAHAQRPHLPIANEEADRIGDGNWVRIKYTLSDGKPGRLEGTITAENHVFLSGFCGGGTIRVHDARGNILLNQPLPTIGVNGTAIGNSTRTKSFTIDLPDSVLDSARSITCRMYYGDKPLELPPINIDIRTPLRP